MRPAVAYIRVSKPEQDRSRLGIIRSSRAQRRGVPASFNKVRPQLIRAVRPNLKMVQTHYRRYGS
jgi:hypothetical protein